MKTITNLSQLYENYEPFFNKKFNEYIRLYFTENIFIPYSLEKSHGLILGKTRQGKTFLLKRILRQIFFSKPWTRSLTNGIIIDSKGDLIQEFYRKEQDIIINIDDERCANIQILKLLITDADILSFVDSFYPLKGDENDYWVSGARDIVTAIIFLLKAINKNKNSDMFTLLSLNYLELLAELLAYDNIQMPDKVKFRLKEIKNSLEGNEKKADSFMQQLNKIRDVFRYLSLHEHKSELDLKAFLKDKNGFIFLANFPDNKILQTPIITTIIEASAIFVQSLSVQREKYARTFYFLDEFAQLPKLERTSDLLRVGATFGATVWIFAQELSSIEKIYKQEFIHSLINNTTTKIIFNITDNHTTEYISKFFGKTIVKKAEYSLNTGTLGDSKRTGMSFSDKEHEKFLVRADELSGLSPLNFYFQTANLPVTKESMKIKEFDKSYIFNRKRIPIEDMFLSQEDYLKALNDDETLLELKQTFEYLKSQNINVANNDYIELQRDIKRVMWDIETSKNKQKVEIIESEKSNLSQANQEDTIKIVF